MDLDLDVKGSIAMRELRESNTMTLLFAMSLLCLGMYSSGDGCQCSFRKGVLCRACRQERQKERAWKLSAESDCHCGERGLAAQNRSLCR